MAGSCHDFVLCEDPDVFESRGFRGVYDGIAFCMVEEDAVDAVLFLSNQGNVPQIGIGEFPEEGIRVSAVDQDGILLVKHHPMFLDGR